MGNFAENLNLGNRVRPPPSRATPRSVTTPPMSGQSTLSLYSLMTENGFSENFGTKNVSVEDQY